MISKLKDQQDVIKQQKNQMQELEVKIQVLRHKENIQLSTQQLNETAGQPQANDDSPGKGQDRLAIQTTDLDDDVEEVQVDDQSGSGGDDNELQNLEDLGMGDGIVNNGGLSSDFVGMAGSFQDPHSGLASSILSLEGKKNCLDAEYRSDNGSDDKDIDDHVEVEYADDDDIEVPTGLHDDDQKKDLELKEQPNSGSFLENPYLHDNEVGSGSFQG